MYTSNSKAWKLVDPLQRSSSVSGELLTLALVSILVGLLVFACLIQVIDLVVFLVYLGDINRGSSSIAFLVIKGCFFR